jgi:hypothetical protein
VVEEEYFRRQDVQRYGLRARGALRELTLRAKLLERMRFMTESWVCKEWDFSWSMEHVRLMVTNIEST